MKSVPKSAIDNEYICVSPKNNKLPNDKYITCYINQSWVI